jgi:hypothetical protein
MNLLKQLSLLVALLLGNIYVVNAQQTGDTAVKKPAYVPKPKKPKPISKETSFGLKLHTNGWGIFVEKGLVKSDEKESDRFYNVRLYQVALDEIKNPKEVKKTNPASAAGEKVNPVIFGKINNFYTLKLGYGYRRMMAGKPEKGNVSMHWVYLGGLSLGLLKPYYIDVSGYSEQSVKYSEINKAFFLAKDSIIGSSGFQKGIGEISIVPGVHVKTALHFDWAARKQRVAALETGIMAEFYSKAIELMVDQNNKAWFANLYVSLQFGSRK